VSGPGVVPYIAGPDARTRRVIGPHVFISDEKFNHGLHRLPDVRTNGVAKGRLARARPQMMP